MITLFAAAVAQTLMGATPAIDPRRLKSAVAGRPTQILVLGSPHLSTFKDFDTRLLEPLLDRLAGYHPDIITIEGLSGQDCEILRRYPSLYADTWQDYCWPTSEVEKETGLSVDGALATINKTLRAWTDRPSAAQRRKLASLFLAANDRQSAYVQWLRLPVAERHEGDGLTNALVRILEHQDKALNENTAVAAVLAARVGLERVYSIDDHSADSVQGGTSDPKAFGAAIQKIWEAKPSSVQIEGETRQARVGLPGGLIELYRFHNRARTQKETIATDMGAAAMQSTPELYGRQYLAWWETRNLRMVANIRATAANKPGARVLSIVGATHKAYVEAYLDMMQDVRIVDAQAVLK